MTEPGGKVSLAELFEYPYGPANKSATTKAKAKVNAEKANAEPPLLAPSGPEALAEPIDG